MFDWRKRVNTLDLSYPTLFILRHAEKAELQANQADEVRPITAAGQQASRELAQWFQANAINIDKIKTSPVTRCWQTTACLLQALNLPPTKVTTCKLLGDPGAYITDAKLAAKHFAALPVQDIIYRLWQGEALEGMQSLTAGSAQLLTAIQADLRQYAKLIYFTHDAILVPLLTRIMQQPLATSIWPDYLQGFIIQLRQDLTVILENQELIVEDYAN